MTSITLEFENWITRLHGSEGSVKSMLQYTDIDRDSHEISLFGGLPRELYFPQGIIIFPRENITVLAPPTRDISAVPVDNCNIRWSKLMVSSNFMCSTTTTKFGNKTRSLRTKQN